MIVKARRILRTNEILKYSQSMGWNTVGENSTNLVELS